ncbi:MAG: hypothetical protein Q9198_005461 [Flavoplaca austrocitrina]
MAPNKQNRKNAITKTEMLQQIAEKTHLQIELPRKDTPSNPTPKSETLTEVEALQDTTSASILTRKSLLRKRIPTLRFRNLRVPTQWLHKIQPPLCRLPTLVTARERKPRKPLPEEKSRSIYSTLSTLIPRRCGEITRKISGLKYSRIVPKYVLKERVRTRTANARSRRPGLQRNSSMK